MTDCCSYSCTNGKDCPVRSKPPTLKPLPKLAPRDVNADFKLYLFGCACCFALGGIIGWIARGVI